MHFSKIASVLAAAVLASAENTITFLNQDPKTRTLHFTGNPYMEAIKPVTVQGFENVTVGIPYGWVGNFFSVTEDKPVVPGMLGEVAFNAWAGITFFDVSAIVNPHDHDGVKRMYPASAEEPFSGCDLFPCNFAYYLPDDVQTRATHETDLICTLGDHEFSEWTTKAKRTTEVDAPVFARDFVQGKWTPKRN
ncbi:DNase1 protein [Podospora didyma]|uniref:DNase1 protein n=1 Tax=Podospora didyma TaxID=330526 RepID=A0AAE0KLN7_9PEZI|nr:DNase1 protein [Podospora didyma]